MEKKAAQPGQRAYMNKSIRPWPEPYWATSPSVGLRHPTRRAQKLSILVHLIRSRHSPLRPRRDLRTCRACRRRYQKIMQSSLAPPRRAIRRPLIRAIGMPPPSDRASWRVCQREAPHPVAGGGHWRRSDRDGPVHDARLDARPARDGDVVLTRERCETVVPAG